MDVESCDSLDSSGFSYESRRMNAALRLKFRRVMATRRIRDDRRRRRRRGEKKGRDASSEEYRAGYDYFLGIWANVAGRDKK